MPTLSRSVALLELAHVSESPVDSPTPWGWPEWREITQCDHAPWSPEATPESTSLPASDLEALKAFVKKYFAITQREERIRFFANTPRVDFDGRKALNAWVQSAWSRWNIYTLVDEVMEAHRRGLYTIAAVAGEQVCRGRHLSHARISHSLQGLLGMEETLASVTYPDLARHLFGPDAFLAPSIPLFEITRWLSNTIALNFQRWRKMWKRRVKAIDEQQLQGEQLFQGKSGLDVIWIYHTSLIRDRA